jgi:hypothetical protein
MTGESQGRQAPRMSRFSQAYGDRASPRPGPNGMLDERAERALHRASTVGEPAHAAIHQRAYAPPPPDGFAQVIDIEYETVPPLPTAPEPEPDLGPRARRANGANGYGPGPAPRDADGDPMQPPPPDLEAIAAALAAEMERNGQAAAAATADAARASAPAMEPTAAAVESTAPVINPPLALPHKPAASSSVARVSASAKAAARAASQAASQTGRFLRGKVGPAATKAAFWIAQNLRRKEIRRRYGKAVVLAHARLLDRRMERHFFISPLKRERFAPDTERAILYEGPVPGAAFSWALSLLPKDLREYAFIDFRAGLGRAMLLAAKRNFERIVGFEHDRALFEDLQTNIAQFPRSQMVCRDVQCFRADRVGISIPEQPCVLYFASAWREELLPGILDYVVKSYNYKPRRIYLILENVDDKFALPANEVFTKVELPLAEKLKLRLFSPMDFQVYRSPI